MPRRDFLQLVDDLHRAHLWGARDRAGGEARRQRIDEVVLRIELAHDVRDDVHDVGIVFEEELVGDLHGADLRHPADIVAAEVEQHQVLGQFLGVAQQLVGQFLVAGRRRAALAGAGDGADRDLALLDLDQDFRARAGDGEVAEIEEVHVGRGVGAAQRAVERRRRAG